VPEAPGGSGAIPTAGESRSGSGGGGAVGGVPALWGEGASGRLRAQTARWAALGPAVQFLLCARGVSSSLHSGFGTVSRAAGVCRCGGRAGQRDGPRSERGSRAVVAGVVGDRRPHVGSVASLVAGDVSAESVLESGPGSVPAAGGGADVTLVVMPAFCNGATRSSAGSVGVPGAALRPGRRAGFLRETPGPAEDAGGGLPGGMAEPAPTPAGEPKPSTPTPRCLKNLPFLVPTNSGRTSALA